jgi:RNA polymerase sigma-70 factor (ECF subfamily)
MNASRGNVAGFRAVRTLSDTQEGLAQTRQAVARAKEGDREAVGFLYSRYAGNVYGYVLSIVHDDHDAEDVTQQVFAKLMTGLNRYNERDVPFSAWLLRLARNAAIDRLRANKRTIPVESVLDTNASAPGDAERSMVMRDAFASLPDDQRDVMMLRHVIGLSPTEIAELLGRSEASVHGLQHRGRRALMQELVTAGSTPATRGQLVAA